MYISTGIQTKGNLTINKSTLDICRDNTLYDKKGFKTQIWIKMQSPLPMARYEQTLQSHRSILISRLQVRWEHTYRTDTSLVTGRL